MRVEYHITDVMLIILESKHVVQFCYCTIKKASQISVGTVAPHVSNNQL